MDYIPVLCSGSLRNNNPAVTLKNAVLTTAREFLINEINCLAFILNCSFQTKLKQMQFSQTPPAHSRDEIQQSEEEELITAVRAPICEMDFSYQTLSESWHTEEQEG